MGKNKDKRQNILRDFIVNFFAKSAGLVSFLGYSALYPFEVLRNKFSSIFYIILNSVKALIKICVEVTRRIYNFSKRIAEKYRSRRKLIEVHKVSTKKKKRKFTSIAQLGLKKVRVLLKKRQIHFVTGIIFSFIFVYIPLSAYSWYRNLPQPILLSQITNRSTKILDRKGRLLYEIYVDRKYDPVLLTDIPKNVIDSTLAIEDSEFYTHKGVRPLSIIRAAKATFFDSSVQGGSTITQQLVKNVLLSPERTVSRKVKEIFLALLVETQYSKNEILELYLNNIAYGGTSWGIQSASKKYFDKDVRDLNLAEASFLAGLPSSPSVNSPFSGNLEISKQRQRLVLDRMVKLGYITRLDADEASNAELTFASQKSYIRAPHFVNYVKTQLYEKYGQHLVDFGGLTVTTTLDLDVQEKAQEIVTNGVKESADLNISNGASAIIDVRSGGILGYVGSVDYFSENGGAFDVVTASRQAGSAAKPITYALAFEKGLTPASFIDDSPITFQSYGQTYTPVNYDGKFHGVVSLRQALANSYNIPAVKLVKNLGVENMVALANKMGLKNWKFDSSYGLSVTLGGKEVRLLDLTNVYATLARSGVYRDVTSFISIKDANGFEIYNKNDQKEERAISDGISYLVTNILSDNYARSGAFGFNNSLNIPKHTVAVKTGTTDAKRDNYTFGYTPSYVVGVWVGNNDNTPMNPQLASGLSGAAPIWNKIMLSLLNGFENETFSPPPSVVFRNYPECKNRSEVFIRGTELKSICSVPNDKSKEKNKKNDRR